ncbi:hypothetical protein N781_14530 [Pontibacillus halophilus JSM 076056 = DSM 19796]|uniref:Membrane-bound metal-dependent hydrolase n=1 Tax=Pontibacillus halophilus JSM 076056 = DSM 19796 TaxID=1385510 RepID=A0A0A5GNE1_9BACI|nr:metal-dependent hydrolase [Pontibacillus halophilus]KGX92768.1 hypothetical protein N781_14530 [Pontibacillus halophilus JSM 076056 = DSM 19796]
MNTPDHAFWTYVASRKHKGKIKYFIIGSLVPDVIYYVVFLYLLVSTDIFSVEAIQSNGFGRVMLELAHALFAMPIVTVLRQTFHSLFVWGVIFVGVLLWRGWKLTAWTALLYGWLGHIIIDLFTHVTDAIPLFYPVSDWVFRSVVSYWDPNYGGDWFTLLNLIAMGGTTLYLVYKRVSRKRNSLH